MVTYGLELAAALDGGGGLVRRRGDRRVWSWSIWRRYGGGKGTGSDIGIGGVRDRSSGGKNSVQGR